MLGGSVELRADGGVGGVTGRGGITGAAEGRGAGGVTGIPPTGRSPGDEVTAGRSGDPGLVAEKI